MRVRNTKENIYIENYFGICVGRFCKLSIELYNKENGTNIEFLHIIPYGKPTIEHWIIFWNKVKEVYGLDVDKFLIYKTILLT